MGTFDEATKQNRIFSNPWIRVAAFLVVADLMTAIQLLSRFSVGHWPFSSPFQVVIFALKSITAVPLLVLEGFPNLWAWSLAVAFQLFRRRANKIALSQNALLVRYLISILVTATVSGLFVWQRWGGSEVTVSLALSLLAVPLFFLPASSSRGER